MKKAVATLLAAAALAACEKTAVPNPPAMLTHKVDSARDRSWWLTRDGVEVHSAAAPRRAIALPGWIWVDEPHCPPALALGPAGEVVVTSNVVPVLWRVDPQTFAVTVHPVALSADGDKDVGFAALAYSPQQKAYMAYSAEQRSVWKIDAELKAAAKVANADLGKADTSCAALVKRLADFATD